MCGYMYYRHVSDECVAKKKHIMKTRIFLWCDKARKDTQKVCPLDECVYRPDMETFDKIPCDMECRGCKPRDGRERKADDEEKDEESDL
ncbi:hypothetical protein SBRCBS47491_005426 [Sporothrix bragantina]|uniref:ShKT domain-containing protein n=1 Tax=Sporothrix bragantina TaxID=671064 RepID=A0ABP0BWU0_9PEZI